MSSASSAPVISPRPSFAAWLFAGFSICVAIFFCAAALWLGAAYRIELFYQRMQSQIENKSFARAHATLEQLINQPRLLVLLNRVLPHELKAPELGNKRAELKSTLTVLAHLDAGRFSDAATELEAANLAGIDPQEIATVLSWAQSLAEKSKRTKELEGEINELSKNIRQKVQEGDLIAEDFGALLGLNVATPEDPEELTPAYQKGVLENLPVLEKLRENIVDLASLQIELEALRTQVQVSGDNKHLVFAEKIERLKNANKAVSDLFLDFQKQRELKRQELTKLGTELRPLRVKTWNKVVQFFEIQARNPILPLQLPGLFL